jgi:UDPglucose 6-dehydrogenase
MKIGVIGTGYVGLIQAVGLAELGFNVVAYDIDKHKIEQLKKGKTPIYEEGLEELLKKNLGRLHFTNRIEDLKGSEVYFICVGTPQDSKGKANLSFVISAAENLKPLLTGREIVVLKSTVPVGTNRRIQNLLGNLARVVSNPEFLREGIAIKDFFNPDRIVLGFKENEEDWVIEKIENLYGYFKEKGVPFVITNWESAELIKYSANTFLAMKISFINEIARLAEKVGADIKTIAEGVGLDPRIGKNFLNAGIGWGGSCFHPEEVFYLKTPRGVEIREFRELEGLPRNPQFLLSWEENKGFSVKGIKLASKRHYKGNLVKIKLTLGREITVTEEHPVVIFKDRTYKVILAGELKEGEWIPLPLGLSLIHI